MGSEGPTAVATEHRHLYVHQQKAAVRPTLPVAMLSSGKFVVTIGAGKLKGVSSTDKHVG